MYLLSAINMNLILNLAPQNLNWSHSNRGSSGSLTWWDWKSQDNISQIFSLMEIQYPPARHGDRGDRDRSCLPASSESEWPATGSGRPELDWGQQLQPQNVIKVCLDLFNFQPLIKRVWNEDWESSRAKSSTQLLEIQSAGFFTSKETESYWLLTGSPG